MDGAALSRLLEAVAAGETAPADAAAALGRAPLEGYTDLGFARLDEHRGLRTGDPEVVYADGKTTDQLLALLAELADRGGPAVATRLRAEHVDAVRRRWPDAWLDPAARCVAVGPLPEPRGQVLVVSAGTSDQAVAGEAAFVARTHGAGVECISDVGVAGVHRILAVRDRLAAADCLVVVAGMEGALPSVVGGLVGVPIVAVPTSVGYGASFGGLSALLGMLTACAPGIAVVNIDNGYGAGVFAARVARRAAEGRPVG